MNFYQAWFTSALFWLGGCITLFGFVLLIFPGYAVKLGDRMNKWVSTESFFQSLDKPHYRERIFYRWHHLFGLLVVCASIYIIYMFLFRTNVDAVARVLPLFNGTAANQWVYQAIIYFFIGASIVILGLGLMIIVRPSLLKNLETRANQWVQTDKSLDKLNTNYEIPENILPGNVRLFGSIVLLGGLYIMLSTF